MRTTQVWQAARTTRCKVITKPGSTQVFNTRSKRTVSPEGSSFGASQKFFERIFFTLLREARIGGMSARVSHRFLFWRAVWQLPQLPAMHRLGAKPARSNRRFVFLAGANADHTLHFRDENLAVADLAGARRADDRADHLVALAIAHHHFDLHFRQKVDDILCTTIELGVAFLPAEALDFGNGQPRQADFSERLAHFVEFERFDDCGDALHGEPRLVSGRVKGNWVIFILRRA